MASETQTRVNTHVQMYKQTHICTHTRIPAHTKSLRGAGAAPYAVPLCRPRRGVIKVDIWKNEEDPNTDEDDKELCAMDDKADQQRQVKKAKGISSEARHNRSKAHE